MKTKYVMITLTEKCNLDCVYCYEKNKTLKSISYEQAIELIERELDMDDEYDLCEITLHGGEPFLEFELLKQVCEYTWSKVWKKKYYFFASTNGTIFTKEIKEWLAEHKKQFICGLSIDGNKVMQDMNRNNSFDSIDVDFFYSLWPKQEVKMTISNNTLPMLADGLIFLHEKGFEISDNFAYGLDWGEPENAQILIRELSKLMNYYYEHPNLKVSRLLDVKIQYLVFELEDDRTCSIGTGMRVYDVDGKQYACHFFEPLSIGKEAAQKAAQIDFGLLENYVDPECVECKFKNVCPTCYGANYAANSDIAIRDKNMCQLTQICAFATAKFMYGKIQRFGVESVSADPHVQKAILKAIRLLQEL